MDKTGSEILLFMSVCLFGSGIIRFFIPGKDLATNLAMLFVGILLLLITIILNTRKAEHTR